MKPVALVLIALAAAAASGCGISTGQSDSPRPQPAPEAQEVDASAELEGLITRQLPRKVRAISGPGAFVTDVRCVHQGGNSYECIASVSGSNAYSGEYEETQLPITGTCDERSCIWRVAP